VGTGKVIGEGKAFAGSMTLEGGGEEVVPCLWKATKPTDNKNILFVLLGCIALS
jgi:hypothetical protein